MISFRNKIMYLVVMLFIYGTLLTGCTWWSGKPLPQSDDWLLELPKKGTVEEQLNDLFSAHATTCDIPIPKNKSYIPRKVHSAIEGISGPGEPVQLAGGSLLWYVYKTNEITKPITSIPLASRLLQPTYEPGDAITNPDMRYNGMTLVRSCAGFVAATVDASSPPYPAIAANASIKADMDQKSTLTVISGHFISPIYDRLSRTGWQSLYTHLQLWEMYRLFPELDDDAMFMKEFDGVMAQQIAGISMNSEFNATADANLVLVKAKLKGGLSIGSDLNIRKRLTVIYSDYDNQVQRAQRFSKLPNSEIIVNEFAKSIALSDSSNELLKQGMPFNYKFTILGVPQAICSHNWTFSSITNNFFQGTPSIQTFANFTPAPDNTPICQFTVSGTPDDSIFSGPTGPKMLEVKMQSSKLINNNPKSRLATTISRSFNTTNHPVVNQSGQMALASIESVSSDKFIPKWNIKLDLIDSDLRVKKITGTIANIDPKITIKCSDNVTMDVKTRAIASDEVFHVMLDSNQELLHSLYDVTQFDRCTATASITLPLETAGQFSTRQLNLILGYPRAKPAPPTPVSPSSKPETPPSAKPETPPSAKTETSPSAKTETSPSVKTETPPPAKTGT